MSPGDSQVFSSSTPSWKATAEWSGRWRLAVVWPPKLRPPRVCRSSCGGIPWNTQDILLGDQFSGSQVDSWLMVQTAGAHPVLHWCHAAAGGCSHPKDPEHLLRSGELRSTFADLEILRDEDPPADGGSMVTQQLVKGHDIFMEDPRGHLGSLSWFIRTITVWAMTCYQHQPHPTTLALNVVHQSLLLYSGATHTISESGFIQSCDACYRYCG